MGQAGGGGGTRGQELGRSQLLSWGWPNTRSGLPPRIRYPGCYAHCKAPPAPPESHPDTHRGWGLASSPSAPLPIRDSARASLVSLSEGSLFTSPSRLQGHEVWAALSTPGPRWDPTNDLILKGLGTAGEHGGGIDHQGAMWHGCGEHCRWPSLRGWTQWTRSSRPGAACWGPVAAGGQP